MEKSWIKWVLILAFLVSLGFVFYGAIGALRQPDYANFTVPDKPKSPPVPPQTPAIDLSKPEAAKQIERFSSEVTAYTSAVKAYEANVTAYSKEVDARVVEWKAKNGDPNVRVTTYEKVVKETLGGLLITPLLAALIIYSGIKVTGDVALAGVTRSAEARVKSP
jgi:hypothetical protein